MQRAWRYFISGDVQGVGFRYFVLREVQRIGNISGYVRNLRDGRVEVFTQGDENPLQELDGLLRRGPRGATVSDVKVSAETPNDQLFDFRITF